MDEPASRQAYCVSTNNFVVIGHSPSTGNGQNAGSSGVVTASFNSALHKNGSLLAVEAVITGLNKVSTLIATSVVIQAQTYSGVWRTVADGRNYCKTVSHLFWLIVPLFIMLLRLETISTCRDMCTDSMNFLKEQC